MCSDRLGLRYRVMGPALRPVVPIRRAPGRSCSYDPRRGRRRAILDDPYEHEIAAVDAVTAGGRRRDPDRRCPDASIWGELLATRAMERGFAGAVLDGGVRDLAGSNQIGQPTFVASVSAKQGFAGPGARVVEYGSASCAAASRNGPQRHRHRRPRRGVVVPAAIASEVAPAPWTSWPRRPSSISATRFQAGGSAAEVHGNLRRPS